MSNDYEAAIDELERELQHAREMLGALGDKVTSRERERARGRERGCVCVYVCVRVCVFVYGRVKKMATSLYSYNLYSTTIG